MSNDVFGYALVAERAQVTTVSEQICSAADAVGVGLEVVGRDHIYGLPEEGAPNLRVHFRLTDGPDSSNASYLVDMVDYAPSFDSHLPRSGGERIRLLLDWIEAVLGVSGIRLLLVAITDANELEAVEDATENDFRERIVLDSQTYAPPNKAYRFVLS